MGEGGLGIGAASAEVGVIVKLMGRAALAQLLKRVGSARQLCCMVRCRMAVTSLAK